MTCLAEQLTGTLDAPTGAPVRNPMHSDHPIHQGELLMQQRQWPPWAVCMRIDGTQAISTYLTYLTYLVTMALVSARTVGMVDATPRQLQV